MTSESLHPAPAPARRTVMAAVGVAGLAVALTACGDEDSSSSSASTGGDGASQDAGAGAGSGGTELAKTSDIPEGGGKVFGDKGVVVTQPAAGQFKAFSSKCTHQGCAVSKIADGVIVCPCHNSQFSAEDGSVKKGPATQPLPAAKITVEGESIKLA
ncbi:MULTISPECIES: Rieske (2Fe-2S) protein [Streptomyces]|uniref:Cytochrome bc1 complex Rieske iron-sulfur subunit n=3 Tax=Streptomyces griseoaurantiacus TaxID=68213 RepID=F3NTF5_9ACTN|nr:MULTISPECIES: Rieske (2Fe-2S) protein [Streptomyces]EGG43115.1 iron sulfur protein [Streptomyces griseoaurantiacus M045]MBA5222046.1 Rieske (2Fe-2S) protein [Streptomyces griseoaurantiacus]MCF0086403.1 Cytochrome b6-f complex iron-sulfur subunit [Streptomyces sp. MH192]MCF0103054.1 Cytochrome b6-f complex iron-sulfur subunit [Streptomyces sp. MH191]MDX3088388.1 Rieske (2Fe-2S) protein [Streptomyces sp. ME12-02E]